MGKERKKERMSLLIGGKKEEDFFRYSAMKVPFLFPAINLLIRMVKEKKEKKFSFSPGLWM